MAIYKKTLKDKDGNIIIPVTQAPIIDVTSIDPGEGSPLAENHFIAVYGDTLQAQTEDIADGAVTADKLDASTLVNLIYPVGSIYMSATLSTVAQVQNALGGTWEKWGTGRVPVGVDTSQTEFNTVGKTGGEKTHKLTTSEMPKHKHTHQSGRWAWAEQSGGSDIINSQSETSYRFTRDTSEVGGDTAHNNLQPYITCYMYKRVS